MSEQPMPAEACTDIGADQDVRPGMQMVSGLLIATAAVLAAALYAVFA